MRCLRTIDDNCFVYSLLFSVCGCAFFPPSLLLIYYIFRKPVSTSVEDIPASARDGNDAGAEVMLPCNDPFPTMPILGVFAEILVCVWR
jgi:hypothetical protein